MQSLPEAETAANSSNKLPQPDEDPDAIITSSSVVAEVATIARPGATDSSSIPIPAQLSIPVQFQNGNLGMGPVDLSQQMSEVDLNAQSPSPLQSIGSPGIGGALPRPGGFMEFPSHVGRTRGSFEGQNFTGGPIMYSDSYPQGALYLGSYSNPMLASWQYNPNPPGQGIK